jgi:hypothetical protein
MIIIRDASIDVMPSATDPFSIPTPRLDDDQSTYLARAMLRLESASAAWVPYVSLMLGVTFRLAKPWGREGFSRTHGFSTPEPSSTG